MNSIYNEFIGKQCIVRVNKSGVHYGTIAALDDRQILVKDYARLWSWKTAKGVSVDAIANNGLDSCTPAFGTLKLIDREEGGEIVLCSKHAIKTIEAVLESAR